MNSGFILVCVLNTVSDSVKRANFSVDFTNLSQPISENLQDALNSFFFQFNVLLRWIKKLAFEFYYIGNFYLILHSILNVDSVKVKQLHI